MSASSRIPFLLGHGVAATVSALLWAAPLAAQADGPRAERTLVAAPPRPFEAVSRTLLAGRDKLLAGAARDSLVMAARSQLGLRYRLGALAPGRAFDCSGLVKWVLGLFEIEMPRTAAQQARTGLALPKDPGRLLPGDLLYFGRGKRVTHIGIYVGEGRYVHASNRRTGVIESPLPAVTSTWWRGARRIIATPLDDLDALFEGVTPVTTAAIPVLRTQ
jgi:cell wall-associated NlpC family hydrolase